MRLSEYESRFLKVVRDGTFDTLGELNRHPDRTFLCFAGNERFLKEACERNDISCVITTEELSKHPILMESKKGIASCNSPRYAFYELHNYLAQNVKEYMEEPVTAKVGVNCTINPTAVIEEGVSIGNNVLIEERVIIRKNTVIGNNVILRAGSIIGGTSLSIYFTKSGRLKKAAQIGKTVLQDNVEIGYHAFIARGFFPYDITVVQSGSFFGSNSGLSHNCKVDKNVEAASLAFVCGCTCIGENVKMGESSLITSVVKVENNVEILPGAVVASNVRNNKTVVGNFAIDYMRFSKKHEK